MDKPLKCSRESETSEFRLLKKHSIQPTADGKILWHIGNFTPDMDKFMIILAFTRAFDAWQALMDRIPPVGRLITFESTTDFSKAHIRILFLKPGVRDQVITMADGTIMNFEHKWPFDGNGGVVAHVPLDSTDIYFDEGENWGDVFKWEGDHLFAPLMECAIHEIGHALDLDHTQDPTDSMTARMDGVFRTLTDDSLKGLIAGGWGNKKKAFQPSAVEAKPANPSPIMIALKYFGIREVAGTGSQKDIIAWIKGMFPKAANDGDTPWCSIFMNYVMKECGLPGTGSGMARSWLKWGKKVEWEDRRAGDVAVFWRGSKTSPSGHVALYINDKDVEGTYLRVLGGNQADSVNIAAYDRSRLLELRRHE